MIFHRGDKVKLFGRKATFIGIPPRVQPYVHGHGDLISPCLIVFDVPSHGWSSNDSSEAIKLVGKDINGCWWADFMKVQFEIGNQRITRYEHLIEPYNRK